jgi:hypothetical protein
MLGFEPMTHDDYLKADVMIIVACQQEFCYNN